MNKFFSYVGALIGSYALSEAAFSETFLSGLDPVFDIVSILGTVVFSGALLWEGIKTVLNK